MRDKNVWSVELADLDRDGIAEIVHSRADGKLVVRNADGTLRAALPVAERVAHFTLEEKRAPEDAPVAVYAGHQGIHRVDVATGIDTLFQTIHPVFTSDVAAARVRLRADAAELYAFLVDFGSAERSFLALYDGSGALVHETVLPVSCRALALDRSDPEGDVIAAGCQGRVVLFGRDLPLLRRALAARETLAGADSPSLADEHRELANAYLSEGRSAEAEPHAWRSIEIFEKKGGVDAPGSAESQAVLAHVLEKRGNRGDAEIRLLRALALATPADGPDHAALWIVHDGLAAFYESGGDRAKAEAHLREALAALPDEDRRTSRLRAELAYRLADLLLADGRPAAAEEAIAIAIEHDTYAFGAEHAEVQTDRALAERIRAAAAATPSPASPAPN
ncbi:MAG TPA: tetratricopeptide repeat protein [Myxococcota bacterium]|nr:tetratricopeptide repeat protein [Myxococcota bacterium]